MLQLEATNKDLERKTKVLSETIKMYDNETYNELKSKYFSEKNNSNPASTPTPHSTGSSTAGLDSSTLNKLVCFFIDTILGKNSMTSDVTSKAKSEAVPTLSKTHSSPSGGTATCSSSSTFSPQHTVMSQDQPLAQPQRSSPQNDHEISNITIDEFSEEPFTNPTSDQQDHLNTQLQTNQ